MKSDVPEPPIELETGARPTAAVIWLHGLGADGNDFVPIVPELRLPHTLPIRFIFPHAPHRPVTINGGYVMRAWYDMTRTVGGFGENADHVHASIETVRELVAKEVGRGMTPARIVVAGFSQGGGIALHAALRFRERLGGIVALSAAVPLLAGLLDEVDAVNMAPPIFLAHGTADPIVPFAHAEQVRAALRARDFKVDWHVYSMAHTVVAQEIDDISQWLVNLLT